MPHLLLVDDNADHLFLTRRALRGAAIDSTGVQTAESALDSIRTCPYDMILLDHNLPGMKGSELIAQIRSMGIDTPVVMVTGGGSEQLAVDALKAGALDYIVKNDGYLTSLAPRIQRALTQSKLERENKKLEFERQAAIDRVNEHARRLRALQEASLRLNSSLRPRDVRTQAVNQAASLLGTDMAAFFLLSEDRQYLHILASRGLSVSYADTLRVPLGEGAIGAAVIRGEPVPVDDVLENELFNRHTALTEGEGYRAVLAAPLVMRGDIQGGIVIYDRSPRPWDQDEITILQTLAGNVAVAYENAQLYDRLATRVTELQTLNRIVTSLTGSTDIRAAISLVTEHLRQLFEAVAVTVVLKEDSGQLYQLPGDGDPSDRFARVFNELHRLPEGVDGSPASPDTRALMERKVQFVPDLMADTTMETLWPDARELGFRSIVSVPLIPQDEPIGAVNLFLRRRGALDRAQRELLETVGNAIGVAMQRASLKDNLLRQEAERLALIESGRMKTEFISTVSHELRTPLASIQGYIQLLLAGHAGPIPPLQLEFIETVGRNSKRLCNLVDDLLDISRIESGTLALARDEVDLGAVVSECVEMITPQAEERRNTLQVYTEEALPFVRGDFQRLAEVVTNFLSNAVKYGRGGCPIEVDVRRRQMEGLTDVVVSVTDHGEGISREEIPKLFRKFYRIDNHTTRLTGGTGLGLAISKYLVELHGGKIWVESEPGEGSVFRFAVPAIHGA